MFGFLLRTNEYALFVSFFQSCEDGDEYLEERDYQENTDDDF